MLNLLLFIKLALGIQKKNKKQQCHEKRTNHPKHFIAYKQAICTI
jgi:hypothetical protein